MTCQAMIADRNNVQSNNLNSFNLTNIITAKNVWYVLKQLKYMLGRFIFFLS